MFTHTAGETTSTTESGSGVRFVIFRGAGEEDTEGVIQWVPVTPRPRHPAGPAKAVVVIGEPLHPLKPAVSKQLQDQASLGGHGFPS